MYHGKHEILQSVDSASQILSPVSTHFQGTEAVTLYRATLVFLAITIMAELEPSQQAIQTLLKALMRNKVCKIYLCLGGS